MALDGRRQARRQKEVEPMDRCDGIFFGTLPYLVDARIICAAETMSRREFG